MGTGWDPVAEVSFVLASCLSLCSCSLAPHPALLGEGRKGDSGLSVLLVARAYFVRSRNGGRSLVAE